MSAWTRREVLRALGALGLGTSALGAACGPAPEPTNDFRSTPEAPAPRLPQVERVAYETNLRALMDTLWPAERGLDGAVRAPGALEVGAEQVLRLDRFLLLAQAQGLLPGVSRELVEDREGFDVAFSRLMEADLDALAQLQRPLTTFRELPADLRFEAVEAGYRDPARAPLLQFVHAACVIAYYGGVYSDAGLVQIGFPPFEDITGGLAVSGYPRPAPDGGVDDYTYNLAPAPTPDDDLSGVLDARGDLL